jgi:16S rRNA processing protein RimM
MVVLGLVLAPYGVRGWVKIRPYTAQGEDLLGYGGWWMKPSGSNDWHEVQRVDGRVHSNTVVAQLAGVATREAAQALCGAQIGVRRTAGDEIYRFDLVGLEVVNREGVALGKVAAVQDYGAQAILRVVAQEGSAQGERLIPYVPEYVDSVDLAAGRIEVDWQPDY